jgi:hypothetical protein
MQAESPHVAESKVVLLPELVHVQAMVILDDREPLPQALVLLDVFVLDVNHSC